MKKLNSTKIFIAVIILFTLILGSYSHKKNVIKQSNTNLTKPIAQLSTKKIMSEKEENPCQGSENIIDNFRKKLPKKFSGDEKEMQKIRALILQDESLKKIVIENNKCGASSASWFANLYSDVGLQEKANEYHNMVLDFANKNNMSAVVDLCGYETVASKMQKLHFCKMIMDSEDSTIDGTDKFTAVYRLAQYYLDTNQGDEFVKLCKKAGDSKTMCFISFSTGFPSVDSLAKKLYQEKKYEQALTLYKKIVPIDKTGLTESNIADMYLFGYGTEENSQAAIFWYKKALEKNYNDKWRPAIINNMCVAYNNQNDYVDAFKCYRQAATMGYALSQMNLAKQYIQGHGTIQDYTKGYAWITVSIAQGLDKDRQADAEKIKGALTYELNKQDKTGIALFRAKNLAQKYYKRYVLHEKSIIIKNKNVTSRIKEAISILTE